MCKFKRIHLACRGGSAAHWKPAHFYDEIEDRCDAANEAGLTGMDVCERASSTIEHRHSQTCLECGGDRPTEHVRCVKVNDIKLRDKLRPSPPSDKASFELSQSSSIPKRRSRSNISRPPTDSHDSNVDCPDLDREPIRKRRALQS